MQIAIFLQMKVFSSGMWQGPIFPLWKSVWSPDITLKKSSHFSSSAPSYSSCYPDFFSLANPTAYFPAFPWATSYEKPTSVKKTGKLQEFWISQCQWAPGAAPRDDKSGAGSAFAEGCSSQEARTGWVRQLRAMLWAGKRRAFLPPCFHRICKWSHSAKRGWTASVKVSLAGFNRDCNRMQLSAEVFATIAS